MNIENVKLLAEIFSAHGLTSLEVEDGTTIIRLQKQAAVGQAPILPVGPGAPGPAVGELENTGASQSVDFNRLFEVTSPLVGVFYAAPSPDSQTYVSIGSKVKKGDILCLIETMKVMNEIVCEQDGEIVDICIKNGDIAEFGQVLFKIF